jgi:signal transduction histidine kinase
MVSGMAPGTRERIFEAFFTTKQNGRGTGLGLANVQETVRNHRGLIEVISTLNEGTQFVIYLPLAEKAVQNRPQVMQMVG